MKSSLTAVQIARICHEANRALCSILCEPPQPDWWNAPSWQTESCRVGVCNILWNPRTTPEESHQSWLNIKETEGWVHGLVKDPAKKQHPCILPYEQLPDEQRWKDHLFGAIVRALGVPDQEIEPEPQQMEAGMAWKDIAASAYRAYAASTGNKNFRGDPMPDFPDLPPAIQTAWEAAVRQANACVQAGPEALGWEQRYAGWVSP